MVTLETCPSDEESMDWIRSHLPGGGVPNNEAEEPTIPNEASTPSSSAARSASATNGKGDEDGPDAVKVQAWKCHKCSRHNALRMLKCPACNSWKGKSKKSTRTSTHGCELVWDTVYVPEKGDEEVKEQAWKCQRCSRRNLLSYLKCKECHAWKGGSMQSTRTSTEGCELVWGVERHDDECAVCGLWGELICCDECDKAYHGTCLQIDDPSTLPDHWQCPACDPNAKLPAKRPGKSEQGSAKVKVKSEVKSENDIAKDTKREEEASEDDECYICCDGGFLVCCDYCDKSFHLECHVPPLLEVPKGKKWKCCECAASSYPKRFKCGQCEACLREDCGECKSCKDKVKFGGQGVLKQVCVRKQCPFKRYAPPATVTPEAKGNGSKRGESEDDVDVLGNEEDRKPAATRTGGVSLTEAAAKGCQKCKKEVETGEKNRMSHDDSCPRKWKCRGTPPALAASGKSKAKEVDQNATSSSRAARGRKPAASVDVPARDDADTFSQATLPFAKTNGDADDADDGGPNDLLRCQMELKRVRAENRRQANEIKRLKSAVQALTASLTG